MAYAGAWARTREGGGRDLHAARPNYNPGAQAKPQRYWVIVTDTERGTFLTDQRGWPLSLVEVTGTVKVRAAAASAHLAVTAAQRPNSDRARFTHLPSLDCPRPSVGQRSRPTLCSRCGPLTRRTRGA